ncbi:MAG: DUF192 domain-containing protein [Treponemataceae bacterium]
MIFVFFACSKATGMEKATIKLQRARDNSTIALKVELALTKAQQAQGFMHRKNIPNGTGMLFVFTQDSILSFWMKNTFVPLSIAYIDASGKICDIFDMEPLSEHGIPSTVPVRYALEVPQGWFEKNKIQKGDTLILSIKK